MFVSSSLPSHSAFSFGYPWLLCGSHWVCGHCTPALPLQSARIALIDSNQWQYKSLVLLSFVAILLSGS